MAILRRGRRTKQAWNPAKASVLSQIQAAVSSGAEHISLDHKDRSGDEIRWAPGALDALMGAPDPSPRAIGARQLVRALGGAARSPSESSFAHFYEVCLECDPIAIIDDFLQRVSAEGLNREAVAQVARRIAEGAPHVGPVKIAIGLLGLSGAARDREILLDLGQSDELTVYSAVALSNLLDDPEDAIWTLARRARGWGRIRAIHYLRGTSNPSIKDWLLREGHRNNVMAEEIAYFCAVEGNLLERLETPDLDDELLDSIAELLGALVRGGPAEDIRDYVDAPRAAQAFLAHINRSTVQTFSRFLTVRALQRIVDDTELKSRLCDWPAEARWNVRTSSAQYLSRSNWRELVQKGLQATDDMTFWEACRVGEELGIDVWPARFERQRSRTSEQWYFLMQTDNVARVERVLKLARGQIDLAKVATGPTNSLGLGAEFRDDSALDFILQDLGRFPGLGWDLICVGLQARVVRTRNMALKALGSRKHMSWPKDVVDALHAATAREPNADTRKTMQELLAGCTGTSS